MILGFIFVNLRMNSWPDMPLSIRYKALVPIAICRLCAGSRKGHGPVKTRTMTDVLPVDSAERAQAIETNCLCSGYLRFSVRLSDLNLSSR